MLRITFVPPAIATPNPITLPAPFPNMRRVSTAQLLRVPNAVVVPNHLAADVQGAAAVSDHAVHSHPLAFSGGGAGATVIPGAALLSASSGAQVVGAGGPAGDGVRDNAAPQAHAYGAGAPVAHGANTGATLVVAAVPTLITNRTFFLSVNTVLGDFLELVYEEEGGQAVP